MMTRLFDDEVLCIFVNQPWKVKEEEVLEKDLLEKGIINEEVSKEEKLKSGFQLQN